MALGIHDNLLDVLEYIYEPFINLDEEQYEALGKLVTAKTERLPLEVIGKILAIGKAYREYNRLPEPKVVEIEKKDDEEDKDKDGKINILYETLTKHLERKFAVVSYGGNPFIYTKSYKDEKKELWSYMRMLIEKQAGQKLDRKKIAEIEREVKVRIIGDTYVRDNPFNWLPRGIFIPVKDGVVLNLDGRRLLLPESPAWGFTYCLNVKYDHTMDCPKIKRFIDSLVPQEYRDILYEAIAAALLPVYQYQGNYMFVGDGSNGKSTFLALLREFLGRENTTSISLQELMSNRFKPAELFGKLANIYADLPEQAVRYTGIFKMLTGGDAVTVEKKYQHPFQFVNSARMYFSANVLPEVDDNTYAFWRRWIVVEFPYKFSENPTLLEEITSEEEKSGLLNIILDYLDKIVKNGLTKTGVVEEMKEKWKERSSSVYAFVKNCLERNPNNYETKDVVYSAYIDFCNFKELKTKPKHLFAMELQRFVDVSSVRKRLRGQTVRCWQGIKLRCDSCELKDCKGGEDESGRSGESKGGERYWGDFEEFAQS